MSRRRPQLVRRSARILAKDTPRIGPTLPLELERIIFPMALENNMADAKNLVIVAKYVFDWLIPIVYKVVLLSSGHGGPKWPPLPLPISKLPRYGRYVQHLFIMPTPENVLGRYLQYCPNIVDLASWQRLSGAQIELIAHLPLTRLTLSDTASRGMRLTSSALTVFSKITHLDLEDVKTRFIRHFPLVTHLAICSGIDFEEYLDVLEKFPNLKVLIAWQPDGQGRRFPEVQDDLVYPEVVHPRTIKIIYSKVDSWLKTAMGEPRNVWELAEDVAEERVAVARARGKQRS
ncbi:hypothetical protein BDN72DRAFT_893555 [Pluteus cervinus]|uniref:Uncharacterized protein n=1 Tax=Pluteus cervinus TaxID=181527 RepID=A0ACD3B810_9AGAR|nr:hypothetical protein BDN72DRAFT_893555 [Pluteus cervinus]